MKVNINRQLAGLEDLLFGEGTVQQERQGELVTVTKINLGNLPFSETLNAIDVLTPIYEEVVPHMDEILDAGNKADEAADSAGIALASKVLAEKWASELEDTEVIPGKYSAFHWAAKASENAATALAHAARTDNPHAVTKGQVGLGNVDNTSDVNKPISIAALEALALKINTSALGVSIPTLVDGVIPSDQLPSYVNGVNSVNGYAGTVVLVKSDIGLGNVDNTSDVDKPVSTAMQTALDLKANIASPTFTGTVGGITKAMVGLSNVDNTADSAKAVLSATKLATPRTIATTGDVTASGSFNGSANLSLTTTLANSGVSVGTYKSVTVDAKGRVTAGSNPTTLSGYGITDAVPSSQKGIANGVASLDSSGLVPSTQLPSYVDDVLEYANLAGFPATGLAGKIYVALDTNKTYRWSGSTYIYITSGAVDSVAGKTGIVTLVKSDVELSNVDNTSDVNKPVSAATQAALGTKLSLDIVNELTATKLYSGAKRDSWTKGLVGFTGAIKIELVNLFTFSMDGMMQIRIKETNSTAIKLDISGRWNASTSWVAYSVVSDSSINVRFARDASKVYVIIGDTTTVWGNTRIEVDDLLTNYNVGQFLSFSISTLSSLSGYTVDAMVNGQRSELLTPRTSSTGASVIPSGTTAQRPASPLNGYMRYNTELLSMEAYVNGAWGSVGGGATGGGATGGGTDKVFNENEYVVTTNYTIPAGKSAKTVPDASGNVTINAGVTVEISAGSRWEI